jgi:hypothetical protein
VLDELVAERLGRFWDLRRQQDGELVTYAVRLAGWRASGWNGYVRW